MPFEAINPPQFPTPIAPYSAAAKAGNTVYVSGVLALGEGGIVLHIGDAAAQTRAVLETIKTTLEAAGATLADVAFNHIFLKDLADKTHRGLRGRVEDGKSAGGLCYGYRVVRSLAGGTVTTGEREIEPAEAAIVERIFREYVAGIAPKRSPGG